MVVTFVYLLQIYHLLLLRTEEQSHVISLRYIEGRDCNTIQPRRDEDFANITNMNEAVVRIKFASLSMVDLLGRYEKYMKFIFFITCFHYYNVMHFFTPYVTLCRNCKKLGT